MLAGVLAASGTAAASPVSAKTPLPLLSLSDPDEMVRATAREHFAGDARPTHAELKAALDSDDPELRQQGAALLLNRPWVQPGDPDPVRENLANYGTMDAEARSGQVELIMATPGDAGRPAVVRILQNDPSAMVRWAAMSALRQHPPASLAGARAMVDQLLRQVGPSPAIVNTQTLALAGWLLRHTDPPRALAMMRQAVDREQHRPTATFGQMDPIYLWLIDRATADGQSLTALQLRRAQARSQLWDTDVLPDSTAAVLALHATSGPFPGWTDDLATVSGFWLSPDVVYCGSHLAERDGHPLIAVALNAAAVFMGGVSTDAHVGTASFLLAQGWLDSAETECRTACLLCAGHDPGPWFELSRLAILQDDEFNVGHYLERGLRESAGMSLQKRNQFGDSTRWAEDDAWAEVHWHYLRAAMRFDSRVDVRAELDALQKNGRLDELLKADPGYAADIVPALRRVGQIARADEALAAAFALLHRAIDVAPDDAEALNNLAWLCARTDSRLADAEDWSNRAIVAAPTEAAYLDTAAEVRYRNGKPAAAAALERRALKITPHDLFMKRQLQRFESAATTRP